MASVTALGVIIRILCLKARSSDAGEAHAAKLIARWSDCENNQAAEGSRLFPDRHIHNQTSALSASVPFCGSTKRPLLIEYEMLLLQ